MVFSEAGDVTPTEGDQQVRYKAFHDAYLCAARVVEAADTSKDLNLGVRLRAMAEEVKQTALRRLARPRVSIATPRGWERIPGATDPPMLLAHATEAFGELVGRAHDARLLHSSVDDRDPWPDAPGPWRIEAPFRVLWTDDEAA